MLESDEFKEELLDIFGVEMLKEKSQINKLLEINQ